MKREGVGRPWPQRAQNPALKMHIASLLDFSLFYFFPQRAAVIYSHQTGLLPCMSPAHVSLQLPYPQRTKTTWPQGLAPLGPCRQLVNPANTSPNQQKILGTEKQPARGQRAVLVSPATPGVESKLQLAVVFLVAGTAWEGQAGLHRAPAFP